MRKYWIVVMIAAISVMGCKKKAKTDPSKGSGQGTHVKAPPAKSGMGGMTTGLSHSTGKERIATVPGLRHAAFIPADAVMYGSIDSKKLFDGAKPLMTLFTLLRTTKVKEPGKPERTIVPPKMTIESLRKQGIARFGIDIAKLGQVTILGVVPPPTAKRKAAFFSQPILLAAAESFKPAGRKLLTKLAGISIHQMGKRDKGGSAAVMGKTVIYGDLATVKKVIATKLGKAPRIAVSADLIKSLKSLRASQPKASSFLVLDLRALRRQVKEDLGTWQKGLDAGGVFFTDSELVAIVHGAPKRLTALTTLIKGGLQVASLQLPKAKKEFVNIGGGAEVVKQLDAVAAALRTVSIKATGRALTIRLKASPVQMMTVAGMMTWMVFAGSSAAPDDAQGPSRTSSSSTSSSSTSSSSTSSSSKAAPGRAAPSMAVPVMAPKPR